MTLIRRRTLLAAGVTLPAGLDARKPLASPAPGMPVPALGFTLADGTRQTLEDYAGRGVVLNLWATWCVPCVAEMPALAGLARALRGTNVTVLPLSSDRGGAETVQRFYAERGLSGLPVLLDPRSAAAHALAVRGIPTTVLIDSMGRERGRMEGAVDWASRQAIAAVRELAP